MLENIENEEELADEDKRVTRGHSKRIPAKRSHLAVRAGFFSVRVPHVWNGLPAEVVNAESRNNFKQKLDRHFHHLKYSTECPLIKRFQRWEERHKG